jgi:hypothetical protein
MIKKILIALVVVVGGVLVFAATRPDQYHIERSLKMDSPAPVVFSQIDDLHAWSGWSPWEKLDPNTKKTFAGAPRGVGAKYFWQGNRKVGKGSVEIVESTPSTLVRCRVEFLEPFAAVAESKYVLVPDGEHATMVTWSMDGKNNLVGKVFALFMNMDKEVGSQFESGLAALAKVSAAESRKQEELAEAKAKAEAEVKARAEAQAAAEKAAAAPRAKPHHKGRRRPR